MVRSFVLSVVFCLLAVGGLAYLFKSKYPFVLASETARTSLEVTTEQLKELKTAAASSDMIAFGIIGAVLAGGFALLLGKATHPAKRVMGLLIGTGLGFAAGSLGGKLGHWFVESPPFDIQDPMMYSFVRWILILGLVAFVAGLAAAIVGSFKKDLLNSVVGAIIGLLGTAAIYALATGSLTTAEQKDKVFPHHFDNQLLMMGSLFVCVSLGMVSQLYRREPMAKTDLETDSAQ